MPLKPAKGYKAKADKLYSQIIRAPGYCSGCGSLDNLQCAHIVSRRFSATRTDLTNAYCLCAKCHFYYTLWPKEFSKFITEHTGTEVYEELKRKAETVTKVDWKSEYERLLEVAKYLQLS